MTRVQKARRANAIARGAAGTHPVALAIVASKWLTQTRYAKNRLHTSQPSLSRYLNGTLETPPEVADRVFEDFGLDDRVWPRPPVRRRVAVG